MYLCYDKAYCLTITDINQSFMRKQDSQNLFLFFHLVLQLKGCFLDCRIGGPFLTDIQNILYHMNVRVYQYQLQPCKGSPVLSSSHPCASDQHNDQVLDSL